MTQTDIHEYETQLELRVIPVTPLQQNCSMLWDKVSGVGVFVDPGGDVDHLLSQAAESGVTIREIWLTHGHMDHVGGAEDIKAKTGAEIIGPGEPDQFWLDRVEDSWARYNMPALGKNVVPDRYLKEGDVLSVGRFEFHVLETPGHTPGHVIIYNREAKIAFVGDVIFRGSVGRTDFPKSNPQDLITSIQTKLWPLGSDMRFIPGHGPASTFGQERADNPFVSDRALGLS